MSKLFRWVSGTTVMGGAGRSVAAGAVVLALAVGLGAWAQEPYQAPQGDPQQDQQDQSPQADPPSQVARISVLQGNVSVEPASVDQFSAAEANYPLTTGDRIYADQGAMVELETEQLAMRMGQLSDLTVTAMTDTLAQLGLANGSVHLRSYAVEPGTTLELDTPNVAVTVLQPGDVRVDVDAQSDSTVVTLVSGQVQVDGNGLQQVLEPGQRVKLGGSNPVSAQWMYAAGQDGLDQFSGDRDAVYQASLNQDNQYVNPGTIGAEDLAGNGDWESDADEGPVWYPSGVSVGWVPYSCGRWAWVAPWGWTWVGCERWGFAPFHYGRWIHRGPRWGWIPGPRVVRPVYSPALVVFVSGRPGTTAWFPLGPRETYVPWYHTSPLYLNRVNVSNIYNRNTAQVRTIYNQRTTNVYNRTTVVNNVYANRERAVAVSQVNFAAGRPVAKSEVQLTAQELTAAPVLPHPLVTPTRSMVVAGPPRAMPVRVARPTLASHVDTGVRAVTGTPQPVVRGGQTQPAAPIARQPVGPRPQLGVVQPQPVMRPGVHSEVVDGQGVVGQAPVRPNSGVAPVPTRPQGVTPAQVTVVPAGPAMRLQTVPVEPRPLFNKAVPPEPRPSFEQQQRAIESTDPGRPLSPKQLDNVKQNQPAGRPQQTEKPHVAAPAPRSAPAAAPKSAPAPPPPDKKHS